MLNEVIRRALLRKLEEGLQYVIKMKTQEMSDLLCDEGLYVLNIKKQVSGT